MIPGWSLPSPRSTARSCCRYVFQSSMCMALFSSMRCETRNERWDGLCSALHVARRGASGIGQDRQCKGAADECFLHRVFVMLARLNSALGLAHPHYILLIHSMLWEMGANMELAMLSRRKTCADRIKHPEAGTEAAPLNPLSAIAPLFRVRPEIQDVCRFALQWEVVHEAEPAGFAQFHIVTNGNCLLERYCGETFKLEAGSILLLPQGDSHVVRSASRGGSSGAPIRTEYNNAIRIKTNTRGASDTEMICGRLQLDRAICSLVTAALPKAIVLSIGRGDLFDRMRMLVQASDGRSDDCHPAYHR